MEKLKEIFHKLKTTEIKFKKPDFSALKEKAASNNISENSAGKFSLQSLRNISLQDIKNFDVRSFYIRYKQQILTSFVVVMGIFFLFYWTNAFLSSKIESAKTASDNTYKKLEKVANMAGQIQFAKSTGINAMTQTLLVYIDLLVLQKVLSMLH